MRALSLASLLVFSLVGSAEAQNWAQAMFAESEHDFGAVARAAKAEHHFPMTNNTGSVVHVSSVRASCGCTTPKITNDTLQPGETASILAVLNSRTHIGNRSATITVTFDQPNFAQARLQIRAFVRRDVVFHPPLVQFGQVSLGKRTAQKVQINYAGRDDWQIIDVLSHNQNVAVELKETAREAGRVSYELLVELQESAPTGFFNDELWVVTNDRREASQRLPLVVEGYVAAPLAVTPSSLFLGELQAGQSVTKTIVIRSTGEPFKITSYEGNGNGITLAADENAKKAHVVRVMFQADQPGDFERQITILTDQGGRASFTAVAKINSVVVEK